MPIPGTGQARAKLVPPGRSFSSFVDMAKLIRARLFNSATDATILDLSRICAAPSARLSHFPFEGDRTFPAER